VTEDPGVEVVRLEAGVVDEVARQEVEMRRVEFKLRGETGHAHADVAELIDGRGCLFELLQLAGGTLLAFWVVEA
jgi:hypothetical protein